MAVPSGAWGGPQPRVSSPRPGRSTLSTVAPWSASSIVASGAASTREKSSTSRSPSGASPMRRNGFRRPQSEHPRGDDYRHHSSRDQLNDGVQIPQLGLRRLPDPARRDRRGHHPRLRDRLPPHRHRRGLPQRGRGRPGVPGLGPGSRRRVHHHQVLQRLARLRAGQAGVPGKPRPAGAGVRGPVPDPLAGALAGQVRRDLEGVHRAPGAGPDPLHRGVQLPARPPAPDRGRDGRDAVGEPGGTAPALPAGGSEARARGPRHRDRGLEPARPGRRARRSRR